MTQETPDKSLLRCTLKKSADVLCKWVLWASYAIVGIAVTALSAYGAFGIWSVVAEPLVAVARYLVGSIGSVFALLAAIPWYCYVGAMALLAIPVYSFLWCVARELTDEDYTAKLTNAYIDFIGLMALVFVAACLLVTFFCMVTNRDVLTPGLLAILFGGIAMIYIYVWEEPEISTDWEEQIKQTQARKEMRESLIYKSLRFPFAYLHYRRRVRG